MSIFPANDDKFNQVRQLNLIQGQYAITSSGPLGIREIRQIGDIDMVVSDELWSKLAAQYEVTVEDKITKIRIGPDIEVLGEGSLLTSHAEGPSVDEQIKTADIIDDLAFVNLPTILYFKRVMNRPKDVVDITAIETFLSDKG